MQHTRQQLDHNVRRTVMLQGLRRIHRLLESWEREEQRARRVATIVCSGLLLIVIAVAACVWSGSTLVTIG